MKAIILAAGYATRLYPLTKDRPKALLPVGGRPILDYITDEIAAIGEIDKLIVISNDLFFKNFKKWADEKQPGYPKEIIVINDNTTDDTNKLGAIGDLQYTINKLELDDDIVVIAGDNLFTYRLEDSYKIFKETYTDLILAKQIDDVNELRRMAVGILDENNVIVDMEEKPKNPKSDIAFFATYFYRKDTVKLIDKYLKEGNSPDAPGNFPAWLYTRKKVLAHLFEGQCYDIGTFESYEEVQKLF